MQLSTYLTLKAEPGLTTVLLALARACSQISNRVRGGKTEEIHGEPLTRNIQGEAQKNLDIVANDIVLGVLRHAPVAAAASEELDDFVPLRALSPAAPYVVLFDPLDGSSNIEVNVSIGTIFSILRAPAIGAPRTAALEDFLQPGRNQVAAGYAIYGPRTELVLTVDAEVRVFAFHPTSGDWIMVDREITIAPACREFAINASNARHWARPVRRYVDDCLAGKEGPRGKDFNMRWIASMVADVHRILIRGGVFLYPWDARDPQRPGKLRLMYEANPMALLVERAGGAAFEGRASILDVPPTGLHQRVSVMLGSAEEIEVLRGLHHDFEAELAG